jgi:predicted transcriptional regulator
MSIIATDCLNDHVSNYELDTVEIEAVIDEADSGEFVSDETVINLFKKWGVTFN